MNNETKTEVIFLKRVFDSPYIFLKYIDIETLKVGQIIYEWHPGCESTDPPFFTKIILEEWLELRFA